jgi:hypothetical protein
MDQKLDLIQFASRSQKPRRRLDQVRRPAAGPACFCGLLHQQRPESRVGKVSQRLVGAGRQARGDLRTCGSAPSMSRLRFVRVFNVW